MTVRHRPFIRLATAAFSAMWLGIAAIPLPAQAGVSHGVFYQYTP